MVDLEIMRLIVPVMRELGVEEWHGVDFKIILGPPPHATRATEPAAPMSVEEAARAKRAARIEEHRQRVCDTLNWDLATLSPAGLAQVDAYIDPGVFE